MNITYRIEFTSYWHIGSGLSGGTDVDALVLKDKNGFPYIPGKTLKGLLRDAAETLLSVNATGFTKDWINQLFGTSDDEVKEDKNKKEKIFKREPGKLYFTNARLTQKLQLEIEKESTLPFLFETIASIRINSKTGTTKKQSLREMEVCVPLTLFAQILDVPNEEDHKSLKQCLNMVKRMGVNRNRGLGRCQLSITEIKQEEVNHEN
ncbi:MAG: RAMP superfamily CRISPR-associated protein [Marinifilaceae bacterium]